VGSKWGLTILERRPWGHINNFFQPMIDAFLSRNLTKICLKYVFFGKSYKSRRSVEAVGHRRLGASLPVPALLLLPTVTTLSNASLALNAFYCDRKRTKVTTANVKHLLLPRVCANFSLHANSAVY